MDENIDKMLSGLDAETQKPIEPNVVFQSRATTLRKRMQKQNRVRNCLKFVTCWFCCTACCEEE